MSSFLASRRCASSPGSSPSPRLPRLAVVGGAWLLASLACASGACSTERSLASLDGSSADAAPRDATLVSPLPSPPGDAESGSCERYCALVTVACTGALSQYKDSEHCLRICRELPQGVVGDRTGNTVACRQTHAGNVARTDPARFCPVAGPFGGGVCGERCDAFCALSLALCTTKGGRPWETAPECVTACTGLRYVDAGADGGNEGLNGPTTGNTLNCRLRQLLEATEDPSACRGLVADGGPCTEPGK